MVHSLSPPVRGHETTLHVLRQNRNLRGFGSSFGLHIRLFFLIVVGKDVDDNPADNGIFAETEISVGLEEIAC